MNKRDQLVVLGALASGLIAGMLLGRRRIIASDAPGLPAPLQMLRLPAPRRIAQNGQCAPLTYEILPIGAHKSRAQRPSRLALVGYAMLALLLAGAFAFERPRVNASLTPQRVHAGAPPSKLRSHVLAAPRLQRAAEALRIDALYPQEPFVQAGDAITVHYITNATQGTLTIADASGYTVQRVPLNASALAHFRVRPGPRDRPFIITLRAARDGRSIEASAGVIVTGKPKATPPRAPASFVVPTSLRSGAALQVAFPPRMRRNASLSIAGLDGRVVARSSPGIDAIAKIRTPFVEQKELYTLTFTYDVGEGTETLIRRIVVLPPIRKRGQPWH